MRVRRIAESVASRSRLRVLLWGMNVPQRRNEALRREKAEAKRARRATRRQQKARHSRAGEVMSDTTAKELTPAKPRVPSRKVQKRDERVRRGIARLRRDAPWLQAPRYGIQLRAYAILWIRFENLHAANGDALDELGKPHPVNDALARIAGKLSQLSRELGPRRSPRRLCASPPSSGLTTML